MKGFKKYNTAILVVSALSLALSIVFYILDYEWYFIGITILVFGVTLGLSLASIIFYRRLRESAHQKQKLQLWNSISYRVKKAGEKSFNEMPLGIILFNDEFNIEWANEYAKQIFESELVERNFVNLNQEFASMVQKRLQVFNVTIYEHVYHCEHVLRDHIIYLSDITKETNVINKYKQRTLAMGILNLDNLDSTMQSLDAQGKALQMSRLIGIIDTWCDENEVALKGYSEERYLLIMDYATLEKVIKEEFSVLANIKNYCEKEGLRITASIGIACGDKNAVDLMASAEEELDLALSRGGNQVIVSVDGEIMYYGARSEAFEARNEPAIRQKTEEIVDVIGKYNNIYIMSHKYMDADAFGACVAMYKLASACNKKAKIVLDEDLIDDTVSTIYQGIKVDKSLLSESIITCQEGIKQIKESDLLIIVDCQYQQLVMSERVYKKAKHIAIIDHHRRNSEAINNFEFIYTQPSSSSSVELIVEMLGYLDGKSYDISPSEAMWMIIGILVDTNNFMFHTTSRTFNVLAKLQSYGAEMGVAQKYLRESKENYKSMINNLNNLEIIDDVYGIVTCDDEIYDRAFIAKIADDVIGISSIKAAFCIGKFEKDAINISARSLDEENVQVIMERLGGGGHYTIAACQMKGVTLEEAKERLIAVLRQNDKQGGQLMKIILTKDVKGKGKANDILDIPMGHANFLIRSGQAVEATAENMKKLEADVQRQHEQEAQLLKDMQELKAKVDAMSVKIAVKVGESGKMFGSVSTKEVVEKFKEQNGIELDKRKIRYDKEIDALGTYKLPIQLHKEVIATITLMVVEGR